MSKTADDEDAWPNGPMVLLEASRSHFFAARVRNIFFFLLICAICVAFVRLGRSSRCKR